MQEAVIVDDFLADWHWRQLHVRLTCNDLRRLAAATGKQRQIVITITNATERLGCPECFPAGQTERAETIGIGKSLQDVRRKSGAQPNIANGIVSDATPLHDQLGIILTQAFDFA